MAAVNRNERSLKANAPLVLVPAAADDRPSWVKVGIIAAVGFAVGVVWPRVAGVRLGPSAPSESSGAASSAPLHAEGSSTTASAPAQAATAAASAVPVASVVTSAAGSAGTAALGPPASPVSVTVNHGVVLSCRTDDGQALKGFQACGAVSGFDGIAAPRLKKLASCATAEGANGRLSLVFNLDFKGNRIGIEALKSSTVPSPEAFSACMKPLFQGVSLGALDHQNPRYALLYGVVFKSAASSPATPSAPAAGGTPATPSGVATTPAPAVPTDDSEASAQVVWEVAIVRDTPRTGQVVARLPRGTRVHLGPGQDGWYRVQYGTGGSEGWLYRGAIGR